METKTESLKKERKLERGSVESCQHAECTLGSTGGSQGFEIHTVQNYTIGQSLSRLGSIITEDIVMRIKMVLRLLLR